MAQVGLDTVASAMGKDVFLLGCGAPIGSAVGRVHANRVSADAGLSWLPGFPLPYYDKWNLPCARNMVRNSICRMAMHGRWWINDPDCMLLRTSTAFSEDEIVGIATVKVRAVYPRTACMVFCSRPCTLWPPLVVCFVQALSGGSFIISDDLSAVPSRRLRLAQQLLPATNRSAIPLDLMEREMPELLRLCLGEGTAWGAAGPWALIGVCNWGEHVKTHPFAFEDTRLAVDDDLHTRLAVHVFEFWSGRYALRNVPARGNGDDDLTLAPVAVHSAGLYAVRRVLPGAGVAQYVGSNLHFSCGLEVKSFTVGTRDAAGPRRCAHKCVVVFEAGALKDEAWGGCVWLYLSHVPGGGAPHVVGNAAGGGVTVAEEAATVDEPLCGAKGTVWKVPVCRKANPAVGEEDSVVVYW
jgi:alpha-galactosidase